MKIICRLFTLSRASAEFLYRTTGSNEMKQVMEECVDYVGFLLTFGNINGAKTIHTIDLFQMGFLHERGRVLHGVLDVYDALPQVQRLLKPLIDALTISITVRKDSESYLTLRDRIMDGFKSAHAFVESMMIVRKNEFLGRLEAAQYLFHQIDISDG